MIGRRGSRVRGNIRFPGATAEGSRCLDFLSGPKSRPRLRTSRRGGSSLFVRYFIFWWSSTEITEAEKREKRHGTVGFGASADPGFGAADPVV